MWVLRGGGAGEIGEFGEDLVGERIDKWEGGFWEGDLGLRGVEVLGVA